MVDLDTRPYLRYSLEATQEEVERRFEEKYGVKPETVEKVVMGKMKGRDYGWWEAGPAPTLESAEFEK
jgi:hypothetical protein